MKNILAKNSDGNWVEAIPEPYYHIIKKECMFCGKKFFTREGYVGHYSFKHILKLSID